MSPASTPSTMPSSQRKHYHLVANSFDRVSSLLVAMLLLFGSAVAVLVIIFLFRKFSPADEAEAMIRIFKPRGEPVKGYEEDLEPPGLEDAPTDLPPQLQETLKELTNAITNKTAVLSNESFVADKVAGYGTGKGHKDYDGTGGEGGNDPPKELRFSPKSDADYAAMLDYYKAEIGVLDRRNNKIFYVKGLSQAKPQTREGKPGDEKRFYFRSTGPPLSPIEVKFARKARIMKAGALIFVFYPDNIANDIFAKEEARARDFGRTKLEEIDRTYFRCEKKGSGYNFTVEDQKYF